MKTTSYNFPPEDENIVSRNI